jgi:hypothetical protein
MVSRSCTLLCSSAPEYSCPSLSLAAFSCCIMCVASVDPWFLSGCLRHNHKHMSDAMHVRQRTNEQCQAKWRVPWRQLLQHLLRWGTTRAQHACSHHFMLSVLYAKRTSSSEAPSAKPSTFRACCLSDMVPALSNRGVPGSTLPLLLSLAHRKIFRAREAPDAVRKNKLDLCVPRSESFDYRYP